MDEKDITYVLEIVKHRSFTKAAEALYFTQPVLREVYKRQVTPAVLLRRETNQ